MRRVLVTLAVLTCTAFTGAACGGGAAGLGIGAMRGADIGEGARSAVGMRGWTC